MIQSVDCIQRFNSRGAHLCVQLRYFQWTTSFVFQIYSQTNLTRGQQWKSNQQFCYTTNNNFIDWQPRTHLVTFWLVKTKDKIVGPAVCFWNERGARKFPWICVRSCWPSVSQACMCVTRPCFPSPCKLGWQCCAADLQKETYISHRTTMTRTSNHTKSDPTLCGETDVEVQLRLLPWCSLSDCAFPLMNAKGVEVVKGLCIGILRMSTSFPEELWKRTGILSFMYQYTPVRFV